MPGCGGKFEPAECICFKNIEELKGKESVSVHKWIRRNLNDAYLLLQCQN